MSLKVGNEVAYIEQQSGTGLSNGLVVRINYGLVARELSCGRCRFRRKRRFLALWERVDMVGSRMEGVGRG